MLLVVAAICGLVLAVWAGQRFGPIVDLPGMASHLVLVGCQIIAAFTLEWTLTCTEEGTNVTITQRKKGGGGTR